MLIAELATQAVCWDNTGITKYCDFKFVVTENIKGVKRYLKGLVKFLKEVSYAHQS